MFLSDSIAQFAGISFFDRAKPLVAWAPGDVNRTEQKHVLSSRLLIGHSRHKTTYNVYSNIKFVSIRESCDLAKLSFYFRRPWCKGNFLTMVWIHPDITPDAKAIFLTMVWIYPDTDSYCARRVSVGNWLIWNVDVRRNRSIEQKRFCALATNCIGRDGMKNVISYHQWLLERLLDCK